MKRLETTILTIIIVLCCNNNLSAQTLISIGGGFSSPSSNAKDNAFLSNSAVVNADVFLPLLKKERPNTNFGINLSGSYMFGGSGGFGTTPNPYAVTGQTSSTVSPRGNNPKNPGFRMGAGPQANFNFGKFIVSPMVLGEYMSITQKEMSSVQTTVLNGQSYDFILASMSETKTSGFAVTPKLRLHYMFNERFGLFADASYTMGPKAETIISKLIPEGQPNPPSNSYNIQQLQFGKTVKGETKSTAFNSMGLNFGVVIGLGGSETKPHRRTCLVCGGRHWFRKVCDRRVANPGNSEGSHDIKEGRPHTHWREHWNMGTCVRGGIYCISRIKAMSKIILIDNNITITTVTNEGEIPNEILKAFINKEIEIVDNELPNEIAKALFKEINLTLPKDKIVIKAKDQKYQVIDGVEGNKIIEVEENTKIFIDGKEYNVKLITSSGKAANTNSSSYLYHKKNDDKQQQKYKILSPEVLIENITSQNSGNKTYYDDKAEDCSATVGIECVDEIIVSDDFDLTTFDKYIATRNPDRIKSTFINNDMEKFLGSFMNLPNSYELIDALKSGDLTMQKIQSKSKLNTYFLGTPSGIINKKNTVKVILVKKHNYVGHVTLLR